MAVSTAERPGRAERWLSLSPRARENILGYVFISPWLIGFLVFVVGAMVASLAMSFFKTDLLSETRFVAFDNYTKLFQDQILAKALFNTAYYSFAMVPSGLTIALMIALVLNQGLRGQSFFRTVYYLPSIVSGVALSVLWAWVFHPDLGLANGLLSLVGIQGPKWVASEEWAMPAMIIMGLWGSGGSMLIFLAGLQGIPTELYEAATIDGATAWHRFWSVTLPMMSPTILFSLVMRIIGSWQVFTQAYVMTSGGPNNATLTMVLFVYRQAFQNYRFGYASAAAWLLFLIILVFTVLVFRSSDAWVYYAGEVKK
jgi:multiple sugar transport system permease protein